MTRMASGVEGVAVNVAVGTGVSVGIGVGVASGTFWPQPTRAPTIIKVRKI
jgi:hypothetical protein